MTESFARFVREHEPELSARLSAVLSDRWLTSAGTAELELSTSAGTAELELFTGPAVLTPPGTVA